MDARTDKKSYYTADPAYHLETLGFCVWHSSSHHVNVRQVVDSGKNKERQCCFDASVAFFKKTHNLLKYKQRNFCFLNTVKDSHSFVYALLISPSVNFGFKDFFAESINENGNRTL